MQGQIIKQVSNDYSVLLINSDIVICKARGKFRKLGLTPLVGDYVIINEKDQYITEILPRKNLLIRPSIANVDQAIVVTSTQIPAFSTNLLDKLLVTIEFNNIKPIICLTKLDLISDEKKADVMKYIKYYRKIGYSVYENTDFKLKDIFKDRVSVLAGQSGAGKSTLLNKLDNNLNIEIGEVSVALGRGRHTTRHTELIHVLDGYVADTPGFSSINFDNMSLEDIRDQFIEFNQYRDLCEYKDCMHDKENGCEIKRRVASGDIILSRYENYLKFIGRD